MFVSNLLRLHHYIIIIPTQYFKIVCIIILSYAKWCQNTIQRVPQFCQKDYKKRTTRSKRDLTLFFTIQKMCEMNTLYITCKISLHIIFLELFYCSILNKASRFFYLFILS